jgi:hypothetical protein
VKKPGFSQFLFFQIQLVRLQHVTPAALSADAMARGTAVVHAAVVGLYTLNPVDPRFFLLLFLLLLLLLRGRGGDESAWFQPLNLSSENLVSSLCFHKMQLAPLHGGRRARGARAGC